MALMQVIQPILFQPKGRLDLQGGAALSAAMADVAPQPGQLWVINLAKVDFIDSSGLVSLVTALKASREVGYRLALCGIQAPVKLIFELTQLDTAFEIFDTEADAIAAFNQQKVTVAV